MEKEKALIAAARQGSQQAFNELVLIYQGVLYNLAYRILGDIDAAADVCQDAFLSAYRGLGKFRGGSFKAWLFRILTNACYDHLRHRKRRPAQSLEAMVAEQGRAALLADPEEGPESRALRRELSEIIQAGIEALPLEQRITLVLADVQGMNYQEVAEITDVSLGTVKSRLSRARAKLRDFLLEKEELLPPRYRLRDRDWR